MGKRKIVCILALAGASTLSAGCTQQDTQTMTRIGQKLAAVLGDVKDNLNTGWQDVYGGLGLESRVAARLHWDKTLSDTGIQVQSRGSEIELKGTVQTAEQRRRAVDLAETTAGVERVIDSLELSGN